MTELPDELLAEFRQAAGRALADLQPLLAALGEGSAPAAIARIAHQLRGTGGSYGFADLSKRAALVEKTLVKELPTRLAKMMAHLEAVADRIEAPPPAVAVSRPEPVTAPAPQRVAVFGEDDPLVVALVKDRLQRDGFLIEHRSNGNDVLELAADRFADIIILDVKLPGLDGFDVLARLRQTTRHARTPIMMLTALTGAQDAVRAFELGANDYVRKPFSPAELLARVKNLTHA